MRRGAGLLLGLLLLTTPSHADEIRLKKGKPLHGRTRRVGERLLVNPYGSTLEAMTWGVVEIPMDEVASVVPEITVGGYLAWLDDDPPATTAVRTTMLADVARLRDRALSRRVAAEILREDPGHASALEVVGGREKWAKRRLGDPRLDLGLRREVGRLLRLDSADMRRRVSGLLARRFGWAADATTVERMARSLHEPRGTRHDVPLAFLEGASCSLYLPEDLHPLEPRPLLVALHGGMTGRGAAARVVGTARDAFELFQREARERRWILVAPTAVAVPWNAAENVALIRAVLAEVSARHAVDLDRCYLVGHDAGADGALSLEGRISATFAAVGAAGALRPGAARGPSGRRVGVWLYQGEQDTVAPVEAARKAAEGLLARKADFVYAELPGMGHGLPAVAESDLFRYLARHRRPRAKGAWPRSSLAASPGAEERRVLGDAGAAWDPQLPEKTADLLALLAEGGPEAEPAARRLVELGVPAHEILADRSRPPRARAWAAWLCGRLRSHWALDALADAVRAETDSFLRREAAVALRRLRVPEAVTDLAVALEDVAVGFGRGGKPEEEVTFDHVHRTCDLAAALVEAYAVSALGPEAAESIETHAVLAILRDRRPVRVRADLGESATAARARLARAVGRAYRTMKAEPTLMDLLRASLKDEPEVLAAAREGYAEGVPKDD